MPYGLKRKVTGSPDASYALRLTPYPPRFLFHHIQFYGVDDDAFFAKACDRPLDFRAVSYQFEVHPSGGFTDIRSPDIRDDLEFVTDLIDDRLFYLVFRKPNVKFQIRHGVPPAMAGTIETSSPSLSEVSLPLRNRISSSLT